MKKHLALFLLAALICPLFAGCTPTPSDTADGDTVTIVATTFPPYDFARAVVGDTASVTMLISPGTSTHTYDPSPQDIRKIQNADLFLYGGGESDAWIDTILETVDRDRVTVLAMTDLVPLLHEEHDHDVAEDNTPAYDEHVWTSPANAAAIVAAICDALCEIDAENASLYTENAAKYIAEIHAVEAEFAVVIEDGVRDLIVFADRYPFLYFSESFGLRHYAAFAGCAHETEAGAQTIARMIDYVKAENIPAVFYIEFSDRRLADAVAEATGCEMLLFHSCHNVSKDDFAAGVTYVSLMRQNIENLRKALS